MLDHLLPTLLIFSLRICDVSIGTIDSVTDAKGGYIPHAMRPTSVRK